MRATSCAQHRRRLAAGAGEVADARRLADREPGVVVDVHVHDDVARIQLPLDDLLLAALELRDLLGRHDRPRRRTGRKPSIFIFRCKASANRSLAIALHLEDVPIHAGCLRRRPASPRSASGERPAAAFVDFRLRPPRRLFAAASSAPTSSSPRRRQRLDSASARRASASGRIARRRHRSWPFASHAVAFVDRRIVAAIAHSVVSHGGSFIVGHRQTHASRSCTQRPLTKHPTHNIIEQSKNHRQHHVVRKQQSPSTRRSTSDHHHRRAKQFAARRPRNLVHLRFDGDQKIGETRHLDHAKADPQADRQQQRQRHDQQSHRPADRRRLARMLAQPPSTQRDDHRQARQTSPAGQSGPGFACKRRSWNNS